MPCSIPKDPDRMHFYLGKRRIEIDVDLRDRLDAAVGNRFNRSMLENCFIFPIFLCVDEKTLKIHLRRFQRNGACRHSYGLNPDRSLAGARHSCWIRSYGCAKREKRKREYNNQKEYFAFHRSHINKNLRSVSRKSEKNNFLSY